MQLHNIYTNNKQSYLLLKTYDNNSHHGGFRNNKRNKSLLENLSNKLEGEFSSSDGLSSGDNSSDNSNNNSSNDSSNNPSEKSNERIKELSDNDKIAKRVNKFAKPLFEYLMDETHQPINYMSSIPIQIEYSYDMDARFIKSTNCHLGQRKLLLTEIEFYTRCIEDHSSSNNLVIYSGSASCEHLPVILSMFKNIKFILIDPNFHMIDADYQYIYQNNSVISKNNYHQFVSYLQRPNSDRERKLQRTTKKMTGVKFVLDDSEHDLFDKSDDHYQKMTEIRNKFYTDDSHFLINDINESKQRVFIIQDYLTRDMISRLKFHIDKAKTIPNIYYVTDIRSTIIEGTSAPSDLDLLWNCALQTIFIKTLQPEYSMLKHRQPFFYDVSKHIFENREKHSHLKFVFDDFDYVKDNYGEDFIKTYLNKEYYYFDDSEVLVQPWAPKGSSETRLLLPKKYNNTPFVKIDYIKHEDKMNAFRYIREYKYFPTYYPIVKNYQGNEWDGCQDCGREIYILGSYLLTYPNSGPKIESTADEIASNLKAEEFYKKMFDLYKLVNKFTYYDLSKYNQKCPLHAIDPSTKQKRTIDLIFTNDKTRTTNIYTIGPSGVMSMLKRHQANREKLNKIWGAKHSNSSDE